MITITEGQAVAENEGLVVSSKGSDYADTDLILCASKEQPLVPIAMYQAQFVRYGSVVYQFNTPEDLGKALYEIDKDSTHDAVVLFQQQAARDAARAAGTLTPDTGADITAVDTVPPADPVEIPPAIDPASSTPPAVETPLASPTTDDTATSTLDVPEAPIESGIFDEDSASTSMSTTTTPQE